MAVLIAGMIGAPAMSARGQPIKTEPCQGLAWRLAAVERSIEKTKHPDAELIGEYANLKVEYCDCLAKSSPDRYKEICADPFPNLDPPCEVELDDWQEALHGDPFGPKRIEDKRQKYCRCLLGFSLDNIPVDFIRHCLPPPPTSPEVPHPRVSPTPPPDPCASAKKEWAERWRDWEADKNDRSAELAANAHASYCRCLREEYPFGLPPPFAEICNYPSGLPRSPVEPPGIKSLAPRKPTVTPTPTPDPNLPPKESRPPGLSVRESERVARECYGGFWYIVHYATYDFLGGTKTEIVEKVEKTGEICTTERPSHTAIPTPSPTPPG